MSIMMLMTVLAAALICVTGAEATSGDLDPSKVMTPVDGGEEVKLQPASTPVFRTTQQNYTVSPGDRVALKCRVDNLGTKTLSWHRADRQHPLTIGLFTFTPDTRMSADYNQRTNDWSLIIQDVRVEDDGVYTCVISSKTLEQNTYHIRLNVRKHATHHHHHHRYTVHVSGTEYVERGGGIVLRCNATGRPEPPHAVEWYREGERVHSDASKGINIRSTVDARLLVSELHIANAKMSDGGDYVCRSSSRHAASVKVHVINVPFANVKRDAVPLNKEPVAGQARTASARQAAVSSAANALSRHHSMTSFSLSMTLFCCLAMLAYLV